MRTSWAEETQAEPTNTPNNNHCVDLRAKFKSFPNLPQHFAHCLRCFSTRNTVHAYQQQNLGMLCRKKHDREAVTRRMSRVRTTCRPRFDQCFWVCERTIYGCSGSIFSGCRHTSKYLSHSWLVATLQQFQVSPCKIYRSNRPAIANSHEFCTTQFIRWNLQTNP